MGQSRSRNHKNQNPRRKDNRPCFRITPRQTTTPDGINFIFFRRVFGFRAFIIAMIADPLQTGFERKLSVGDLSGLKFDPDLMTQAKSDPGVFTRLYLRHYDAVFRYCMHRLFDRNTAEDITSEVFLSMMENFQKFEGDEKQFRNWLYRIATNAVNQHLRKTVRRSAIMTWVRWRSNNEKSNEGASPDESQQNLAVIKKAMLTLKSQYQAIVTMRFFENLKTEEIAEVFGTSAGTVRSQLSRALSKLRKYISCAQVNGQEAKI
jgi:RNA polymerase sigma factor (sigma-70 family)